MGDLRLIPGGASAGKFDFPEKALRPDFAAEEQWDLLCSSATPVRKAAAIVRRPSKKQIEFQQEIEGVYKCL